MKSVLLIAVVLSAFLVPSPLKSASQASAGSVDPKIEADVVRVLKDYMDATNRLDIPARERTFHFPHYRLASGRMTVLEGSDDETVTGLRNRLGADWDHSAWGRLRIIHSSPDKVHIDTLFIRYRKDGSTIGSFESLYVVTKEQGRWGIKLRSSMAP